MVMNQKLLDEWNFPCYRDTAIGHENTHSRLPDSPDFHNKLFPH